MIAITGVGAVTALGKSASETFDRLLQGERGFAPITLFEPGEVKTRLVGEVKDLRVTPQDHVASRTSELALAAAREAIAQAGLSFSKKRIGLVLGGTTAGMFETESLLATLLSTESAKLDGAPDARGERDKALSRMLSHPLSAPTDRLVQELGPFARARSLSSACSSGANALLIAATWLELGLVDAVLCGAADSLCRVTLSGFNALAALDPSGARPFDVRRRGLTLGEGAGMLVLEREADAAARGKRAICMLLGWASRSEAHHITNPEPTGEAPYKAMQAALARAELTTSNVDYVNAHGTGTPLNDSMETRALERVFGDELARIPVSSQKGMIGHTLAAAGAIEAVITVLAIDRGVLPPTGGLEEIDPACASLRHVTSASRQEIRTAVSSSFGFGGMDTALVFGGRSSSSSPSPSSSPASPKRAKRDVVITGVATITPAGVLVGSDVADLAVTYTDQQTITLAENALDPERARRLDRASRLAAVVCGRALGETANADANRDAGVILGIAFGAVDATAEFMRRLRDKGPRLVKPAEFPSLVPSSPAGYVSIYHRLTGPALVVADLAASGECAVLQAFELIACGEADRICAGAVEERSAIVEEVLSVVFGGGKTDANAVRREGAAAIALAAAENVKQPFACLSEIVVWRDDDDEAAAQAPAVAAPPPSNGVVVVGGMGARPQAIANRSAWASCPRVICADATGAHEATGAMAIAVAAAKVARGDAAGALFVGSARGWSYAGTVWPPHNHDHDHDHDRDHDRDRDHASDVQRTR